MKEAYCSYEVSKLLKEKGFDIHCDRGWNISCYDVKQSRMFSHGFDNKEEWISSPTHQMACAWLRGKGYHVFTYRNQFNTWSRDIQASTGVEWTLGGFNSHYEAVEEAIKYVLENLI